jgi:hypothetical protein
LQPFLSPSAASFCFAPVPPCWPFGPDPGLSPLRFRDQGRPGPAGPRQEQQSHGGHVRGVWPGDVIIVRRRSRLAPAHSFPLLGVSTPRSEQVQGPLRGCVGPTGSDPALFPPGTASQCVRRQTREAHRRADFRPPNHPTLHLYASASSGLARDGFFVSLSGSEVRNVLSRHRLVVFGSRRLADAFAVSAALQGGATECITLVSSAGGPGPCLVPSPGWQDRCREVDSERIPRGKCLGHGK